MIQEKLQKAREYEAPYIYMQNNKSRPKFHLTPTIGWMNDPNGFSYYKGEYHLFYQYHPYTTEWGPMHWGHVKTTDFLSWEHLPIALAPDKLYDKDGCFSGSAVEMPDGRHMLVYTGVHNQLLEDGQTVGIQTQCIAFGDGVNYKKFTSNPVIDSSTLPEGHDKIDFRDPKVWIEQDGTYKLVVANKTSDGGAVLLYHSPDGICWNFETTLDSSHNKYAQMWECPDFFSLDGKQIILVSAQGMNNSGLKFPEGNGTIYIIGNYDTKTGIFSREQILPIDYGIDFYAPQTVDTPDGRRIMIGWMQNWGTLNYRTKDQDWFGQMSIPRELSIQNGRLIQTPVRELNQYRNNKVLYRNVLISGERKLSGIKGRTIDLTVNIHKTYDYKYDCFQIEFAKDALHSTSLSYYSNSNTLKLDRTNSKNTPDAASICSLKTYPNGDMLRLRLIIDKYSVEVFVNNGESVMSMVICTAQNAESITFNSDGNTLIDIEKYDIKS